MRRLDSLTPTEKRILAGAVALACVVGGFTVAGDDPLPGDPLVHESLRTEASTSTTTVKKESVDIKVGDSKSSESSSVSRTVYNSVITKD